MTPLLPPLLLLLAHRAAGQVFFKGKCPDPPTVVNFKTWLFEGTWYETQRWYSIKDKDHCVRHTFSDLGYGKLDVLTEMTKKKKYEYKRGTAHLKLSRSGDFGYHKYSYGQTKYTINYDDKKSKSLDYETFFVLDTDYWTYAIIWSCSDKKIFNMQYLHILTRSPYPHSHTLVRVYRELEYLGLDQKHLVLVDDKDECHYQVAHTHKKDHYSPPKGAGVYSSQPQAFPFTALQIGAEHSPRGVTGPSAGYAGDLGDYGADVGGYGDVGLPPLGTGPSYGATGSSAGLGTGYSGGGGHSAGGGFSGGGGLLAGSGYSGGGGLSGGGGISSGGGFAGAGGYSSGASYSGGGGLSSGGGIAVGEGFPGSGGFSSGGGLSVEGGYSSGGGVSGGGGYAGGGAVASGGGYSGREVISHGGGGAGFSISSSVDHGDGASSYTSYTQSGSGKY